jgi:hypothetical protein
VPSAGHRQPAKGQLAGIPTHVSGVFLLRMDSVLAFIGELIDFLALRPGQQVSTPVNFFPLVVAGIAAILLLGIGMMTITLGMLIDSLWRAPSVLDKIGLFLLFFFTAPFGPTLYFFCVYRRRVLALRERLDA